MGEGTRLPMVNDLEVIFPTLQQGRYRITSPRDTRYNCIAWAARDEQRRWWPDPDCIYHWPEGVIRDETLSAFQNAFGTINYVTCVGEDPEPGFERIALFADAHASPTHAARQLTDGRWTSKLGRMEDIEHDLHDLEGSEYGSVALIMKRPLPA